MFCASLSTDYDVNDFKKHLTNPTHDPDCLFQNIKRINNFDGAVNLINLWEGETKKRPSVMSISPKCVLKILNEFDSDDKKYAILGNLLLLNIYPAHSEDVRKEIVDIFSDKLKVSVGELLFNYKNKSTM